VLFQGGGDQGCLLRGGGVARANAHSLEFSNCARTAMTAVEVSAVTPSSGMVGKKRRGCREGGCRNKSCWSGIEVWMWNWMLKREHTMDI
jgi:hypothetical protein